MNSRPPIQARAAQGSGTAASCDRATYQDVLDAPPHKVAEVVAGSLHLSPRPSSPHAMVNFSLGDELVSPYQKGRGGPGGWWILGEPELHFGTAPHEDILVPDIAGWRRERMPEFPKVPFFTLAPDWVCEILSPSTRHLDLGKKRDIYAREGVAWLWLIDPEPRTLEAFELQNGHWQKIATLRDDDPVSLTPFDAITFSLKHLWP